MPQQQKKRQKQKQRRRGKLRLVLLESDDEEDALTTTTTGCKSSTRPSKQRIKGREDDNNNNKKKTKNSNNSTGATTTNPSSSSSKSRSKEARRVSRPFPPPKHEEEEKGEGSASITRPPQAQAQPLSSSLALQELETLLESNYFTYPKWQEDVQQFRCLHSKYYPQRQHYETTTTNTVNDWVLSNRLESLKNKQQVFVGDRSHPFLKALDALLPHLTYRGWNFDYQSALRVHFGSSGGGHQSNDDDDNNNNSSTDWNRQRCLWKLRQKQCVLGSPARQDRSHPRLVELDSIARTLTYPGHERDIQQCQELHFHYADDYIGNNILSKHYQALRNRQKHWQVGDSGSRGSGKVNVDGKKENNKNTTTSSSTKGKEVQELETLLIEQQKQQQQQQSPSSFPGDNNNYYYYYSYYYDESSSWQRQRQPNDDDDVDNNNDNIIQTAMETHLHGCAILEEDGQIILDYKMALKRLQHKNALQRGDRSHPRLQALDDIIARTSPSLCQTPLFKQLVEQCEYNHIRYPAEDDWIGNTIYQELLDVLQSLSHNHHNVTKRSVAAAAAAGAATEEEEELSSIAYNPSTPSKKNIRASSSDDYNVNKEAATTSTTASSSASSPMSTATLETAITTSSSWSSDDDDD